MLPLEGARGVSGSNTLPDSNARRAPIGEEPSPSAGRSHPLPRSGPPPQSPCHLSASRLYLLQHCIPISDEYGPPGQLVDSRVYPGSTNDFDALVLSHETLPTGRKLNKYRESVLGLEPLKLLCTQRTEPHGMSSTALRRMRMKARK